ncbi:hypothetical protein O0L34_g19344 [Tuta absoluta]|nr:hypothetical protein O0L34_g19344 [Tuta absoluta]
MMNADGGKASYAETIQEKAINHEEKKETKKKERKKKIFKSQTSTEDNLFCENLEEARTTSDDKKNTENEESGEESANESIIWRLIEKMKNIVFLKRLSVQEKIMSCGRIILDEFICYLTVYYIDWPIVRWILKKIDG